MIGLALSHVISSSLSVKKSTEAMVEATESAGRAWCAFDDLCLCAGFLVTVNLWVVRVLSLIESRGYDSNLVKSYTYHTALFTALASAGSELDIENGNTTLLCFVCCVCVCVSVCVSV